MRKWAKQGFLNPADSNDDGWYKFSIRPKMSKKSIGMSIQYIISDCSNKIYLEFDPDYVTIDAVTGAAVDPAAARGALRFAETRKKKIRDFAAAVALSAEKIEESINEYQVRVSQALDRIDSDE